MFYNVFSELCKQKGVKPTRALADAGVPKSAWTYWTNAVKEGNDPKPTTENVERLSKYFGVSIDYLLTGTSNKEDESLKNDLAKIENLLRSKPEAEQKVLIEAIFKFLG